MEEKSVIETVSTVDYAFNDLKVYFDDKDLDEALSIVVKLIKNPDVVHLKVPPLIVKVQALSAKYQVLAAMHSTISKGSVGTYDNNAKNVYYSLSSALDKLAQSLKYLVRQNY